MNDIGQFCDECTGRSSTESFSTVESFATCRSPSMSLSNSTPDSSPITVSSVDSRDVRFSDTVKIHYDNAACALYTHPEISPDPWFTSEVRLHQDTYQEENSYGDGTSQKRPYAPSVVTCNSEVTYNSLLSLSEQEARLAENDVERRLLPPVCVFQQSPRGLSGAQRRSYDVSKEFAMLFPSLSKKFSIRHDDSTADGNLNLRVDTTGNGFESEERKVQLFHLRMFDITERVFDLRRYCRGSGAEVCMSRRVATDAQRLSPQRPQSGFRRSVAQVMKRLYLSPGLLQHKRSGSTEPSAPSFDRSECGESSSIGYNDTSSALEQGKPSPGEPSNTIRLDFRNCARVEMMRRAIVPFETHNPPESKVNWMRYYFEYWGNKYVWRRHRERDTNRVKFILVRCSRKIAAMAEIVVDRKAAMEQQRNKQAGFWVPPCHMSFCDPFVLSDAGLSDVIMATGLIALVDDCICQLVQAAQEKQRRPNTEPLYVPLVSKPPQSHQLERASIIEYGRTASSSQGTLKQATGKRQPQDLHQNSLLGTPRFLDMAESQPMARQQTIQSASSKQSRQLGISVCEQNSQNQIQQDQYQQDATRQPSTRPISLERLELSNQKLSHDQAYCLHNQYQYQRHPHSQSPHQQKSQQQISNHQQQRQHYQYYDTILATDNGLSADMHPRGFLDSSPQIRRQQLNHTTHPTTDTRKLELGADKQQPVAAAAAAASPSPPASTIRSTKSTSTDDDSHHHHHYHHYYHYHFYAHDNVSLMRMLSSAALSGATPLSVGPGAQLLPGAAAPLVYGAGSPDPNAVHGFYPAHLLHRPPTPMS